MRRLDMLKAREILRLKHEAGLSLKGNWQILQLW